MDNCYLLGAVLRHTIHRASSGTSLPLNQRPSGIVHNQLQKNGGTRLIQVHSTCLEISHFSTSSPAHHFHSNYSFRRHDEDVRNVRISVWWDFENCHLPAGVNVFKVAHAITAAIRANGIKGPIQITAFGDMLQLSRANQEALSSTGVNLTHVPHVI
ncbi:DNA-binding protein [Prunus dulcis]|uniref:DNA-binding protein n=1 Tax=Prunus dulcis TaxID=3755 RepID=A0A4Y1RWZ6_PRUDU|nr:DNA-binding protein [Prunus dulcis]